MLGRDLLIRVLRDELRQRFESIQIQFRDGVARRLNKVLGLRAVIEVADPGSIPRTDFKARRVIDDRAVFRDMRAQIERKAAG